MRDEQLVAAMERLTLALGRVAGMKPVAKED
jgi:hypothetical protein